MVGPDLLSAFRLLKQVEPTAELIVHTMPQGSYQFSLRVKGRLRFANQPALHACEKICVAAKVHVCRTKAPIRPGMSVFDTLFLDKLQKAGFAVQRFFNWNVPS